MADSIPIKLSASLGELLDIANLDDHRTEALIERFATLCCDPSYHVRRACASNFGEFTTVIGQELNDDGLLPQFKALCEDVIWGVRKVAADVFVPVSCICSNKTRREVLTPLFVNLLCDQSKWVKQAAFHALGPFISTFADPTKTGLYYNDGGVVVIDEAKDGMSDNDSGCSTECEALVEENNDNNDVQHTLPCFVKSTYPGLSQEEMSWIDAILANAVADVSSSNMSSNGISDEFNTFQYWRAPLPEIDAEILKSSTNATSENENVLDRNRDHLNGNVLEDCEMRDTTDMLENFKLEAAELDNDSEFLVTDSRRTASRFMEQPPPFLDDGQDARRSTLILNGENSVTFSANGPFFSSSNNFIVPPYNDTDDTLNQQPNFAKCVAQYRKVALKQDIIPNELLEHYLSMTNPIYYQTVDVDLTHHCAYSFPAVALTLGRKYWPCLKETFELLALDMQWKVRWTLASSLHQMALILGPQYTSRDLLPVFLSFMKDLDEVRFGILQHLAAILRILNRPEQLGILPRIAEFLKVDNNRNWRFRSTLAEQINEVANLYEPEHIKEFFFPIAFVLLRDRVAEVRLAAIKLLSTLIKNFFYSSWNITDELREQMTSELRIEVNSFMSSPKWIFRQAFVLLCEQLLIDQSLPVELFSKNFLDTLLEMSSDKVPNVRLALARCLGRTLLTSGVYESNQGQVEATVEKLNIDRDQDVRQHVGGAVESPILVESDAQEPAELGLEMSSSQPQLETVES
ncbi:Serine/threonine-protein phosphatase 4 regulatory subunit 1 [Halotydeus destructor]|nr:Serine/threonine-protein phosphatase 4 regulatory subunit 1 [Halotydeus destructor]